MARVQVQGDELTVQLNWLEKFLAWHRNVRVPLRAVHSASALGKPLSSDITGEIRMGFAARTALGQKLICCGPRATWRGGQALVVVYGNRRSLVVELEAGESSYRLFVVSVDRPDEIAQRITDATRS